MKASQKDFLFPISLLFALSLFYPSLFLVREAPLSGDHLIQHYPWAFLLFNSVRSGMIPFWTDLVHCGFPITAEAQIGSFYLPNLLLYLLLPFRTAYSYTNLVHYFISGLGTYLYCRQINLKRLSASISSFIFVFGSAYGGAFYNITSLKVISWFPWCLFWFECFLEGKLWWQMIVTSICISLSLLAGYPQVGIYTLGIFILYSLFRISSIYKKEEKSKIFYILLSFITGLLIAFLLCLPQILLSLQLAFRSTRVNLTEDYVYVGSMPPLALLTVFFPVLQGFIRGNCLYNGLLSIFFVLITIFSRDCRKNLIVKLWFFLTLLALFLAFGEWSPFYILLIKLSHFYSFRTPSKFLVYVCFGIAILAGFGFEKFIERKDFKLPTRWYIFLSSTSLFTYLILYCLIQYGRGISETVGKWFIQVFIYGRAGHPHFLSVYYEKLEGTLNAAKTVLSFHEPFNVWTFVIVIFSIIFISMIQKVKSSQMVIYGSLLFLFCDLRYFAEIDMKRDFESYAIVDKYSQTIETLKKESSHGKVTRVLGFCDYGEILPITASENMLYGFEDIGVYSPFVMKRYFTSIGQFGNINDSNFAYSPSVEFLTSHINLLSFLDISHVLSTKRLVHHNFLLLAQDDNPVPAFLYQFKREHSRAYFIAKFETFTEWEELQERLMEPGFDPRKTLLIEKAQLDKLKIVAAHVSKANTIASVILKSKSGARETWQIQTSGPGFFVLVRIEFPGWKAKLNGKTVPIITAYGLFQAIWIPEKGNHELSFNYKPELSFKK